MTAWSSTRIHVLDGKQTLEERLVHETHLWEYLQVARRIQPKEVVGDVGCGHGDGTRLLTEYCRGAYVVGLDRSGDVIKQAQINFPDVTYKVSDLGGLSGGPYDTVLLFQVIEHIDDALEALESLKRSLHPGGRLFLTTPDWRFRLKDPNKPWNPEHVREYDPVSLEALVKHAGFRHVLVRGVVGSPWMMAVEANRVHRAQLLAKWDILQIRRWLPWQLYYYPYRWVRRVFKLDQKVAPLEVQNFDWFFVDPSKRPCIDLFVEAVA